MPELGVIVEGQSNSLIFADRGGAAALEKALEAALPGVDVKLHYRWGDASGANSINSATALTEWDTGGQAEGFRRFVSGLPADDKADPTITILLHSEYDQKIAGLTADTWASEARALVDSVRGALGQGAETSPVVLAGLRYPYGPSFDAVHDGMEKLAADQAFNASVSDAALSLAMTGGPEAGAGSSHMSDAEAVALGKALAAEMVDDAREALAAAAGEAPAPAPTPATPPATDPDAGFTLVMADDFSQGYKTENWGQPFHGGDYGGKGVWAWDASQVAVRDGVLDVSMTRQADGYWLGGGLNSFKANQTITYGKFEFDGRVDEGQGTMGVFLTWPKSDTWPVDGEIDILETPGGDVMHTTHWEGTNGQHYYDAVRNQSYDETQWQSYEVLWLPDYLGIKVSGKVVAEWTDPEMIPDVAHGLGAMGNVAGPNDGWMGGPTDGSTPGVVKAQMDNVELWQWDGGAVDVEAWKANAAPTDPQPPTTPTTPTTPTQPGGPLTGGTGSDHLQLWVSQHEYQGDAQFTVKVDGAQVGGTFTATHEHGVSAQAVDLYGDWAPGEHSVEVTFLNDKWDGTEATDRNLFVNGALENGVAIVGAEQPVMGSDTPGRFTFTDTTAVAAQPVDPVDPEPEEPPVEEPAPAAFVEVSGGTGRDTLRLDGAFRFQVDAGDGRDVVVLGEDHGDSVVVMKAGEARGDRIEGFADGDVLELVGFGAGAELTALGGGDFRVEYGDGMREKFTLAGVNALTPDDYAFV